jgi:hypothetical protein
MYPNAAQHSVDFLVPSVPKVPRREQSPIPNKSLPLSPEPSLLACPECTRRKYRFCVLCGAGAVEANRYEHASETDEGAHPKLRFRRPLPGGQGGPLMKAESREGRGKSVSDSQTTSGQPLLVLLLYLTNIGF